MQASERIRQNLKRRKDNTPEPKRSIWREEIALGSEKLALLVEKEAQTKAEKQMRKLITEMQMKIKQAKLRNQGKVKENYKEGVIFAKQLKIRKELLD